MANARFGLWHRAGPIPVLALGGLLIAAVASGCDGGNDGTSTNTGGTGATGATGGTGATGATGGSTGGGGTGGSTGGSGGSTGGGSGCETPTGLSKAADAYSPLDSTPSSDATFIYFTAHNGVSNGEGDAGIYGVDTCKGTIFTIAAGGRIAAPVGISITSDDASLYVADAAYDVTEDDPTSMRGALLRMGTSADSTPSVVTGTEGYRPRGVDIVAEANGDVVYFSGVDPNNGEPGIFSIPAAGGAVSVMATGAPFEDPSGVAVLKERVFVTDTLAADQRFSAVLVVEGGAISTFVPQLRVGYPAGIAVSMDGSTLYVSGIDPVTETDVVYFIDVATQAVTPYTDDTLNKGTDAGGLHRARNADLFSWCNLTGAANGGGTVFKVKF